jgi:hypothetical protein
VDQEAPAVRLPAADMTVPISLDPFQHGMQPQWEANSDSTSTARGLFRVGRLHIIILLVVHMVVIIMMDEMPLLILRGR